MSVTFWTKYQTNGVAADNLAVAGFAPASSVDTYVVYGISPDSAAGLRFPFNRADYYIKDPSTSRPQKCAPNTGILHKRTLNHADGAFTEMPILDCVADMEVVFQKDTNSDALADTATDDISLSSASDIRSQVKEIRVYILAHEGQKDTTYTHQVSADDKSMCGNSPTKIYVGDKSVASGKCFDITTNVNYRWRLYTIVIMAKNLR